MAKSAIVYASLSEIIYARAFFLTAPSEHPLMAGETRSYPAKYAVGSNEKATGYRLDWYADQSDADARSDKLTDAARLPRAEFIPASPNTNAKPDELQDAAVILTAPASNGYENPVGVLEMVQETSTTPPYLYLLDDEIEITAEVADYRFRYKVGDPAATAFILKWYATRLDAKLMVRQLTDTDRLPTAQFIPATPNTDADAEVFQDGVLRLSPAISEMPYTSAVGLLCMVQDPIKKGDSVRQEFTPLQQNRRGSVISNWRRK